MRKKVNGRRVISKISLFVSAAVLMVVTFHSCQQDELILESEEMGLKSSLISEIVLNYPDEVNAGEDFDITFSATCGRIMIERGFIAEFDEYGTLINKVYAGLNCDSENLVWEAVGEDLFEDCGGATITENLAEPGTYIYRAKLNFKAERNSGCLDCETFVGNEYECFMLTVVEESSYETFTDARDGKVYKFITIGTQTWMAENLAYNGPDAEGNQINGIYAYNNDESHVPVYGWLYTWNAAMAACPAGWHLPTFEEYNTLFNYLIENGYGYEGSGNDIAKSLAATSGWDDSPNPGYTGNDQASNNSSGLNLVPGGELDATTNFWYKGQSSPLWTSTRLFYSLATRVEIAYNYPAIYVNQYKPIVEAYGVRCVKDAN